MAQTKNKSFYIPDSEIRKIARDVEAYKAKIRHGVIKEVQRSTLIIQTGAKQRVQVDTGTLKSRIESEIIHGGFTGRVLANTEYAEGLELGTKAHIIRPRRSKRLAWKPRGSKTWITARQVSHPGTKAYPFLKPALDKETPRFIKRIATVIDKSAK